MGPFQSQPRCPTTHYPGAVVRMLQRGGDFFPALLTCADKDLHILPGHPPSSKVIFTVRLLALFITDLPKTVLKERIL